MRRGTWLTVAAIAALLPAAVLSAAFLVDPDDYKPQLVAAVQEATGRTLTLEGKLRISRSLWPTVEVSGVSLANLPGGSRPDMARAERIEAQLSLPALLWRRIEVIRLTLIGPNILLEQVDGKPNWEFKALPGPAPGLPPTPFDPGLHPTLRFQTVHVQNGMVTFRLPARTKVVGIRSLDFQRRIDRGPIEVDSVLVYSDYAPFSLRATAQPTGGDADPWNTQLAFAAYDTSATATGTMNLTGDYDLQLDGTSGALEKLNALLPEMQLPALHAMTLSTHLTNGTVRGSLPVIGQTRLHFASADLADRVAGLTLGATDISLPAAEGLAAINSTGSYARQAFSLKGSFGVPRQLDGKAISTIDLTIAGLASSLAVKGKLGLNTLAFNGMDGAVALRTPALANLAPLVSNTLPALMDVALDSGVAVPANLKTIGLKGAKLRIREGSLSGDVTIGPGTAISGKLGADRLDLDALLPALGVTLPAGMAAAAGTMIPDTTLPWSGLRGPDIDLTGSIGTMTLFQQNWANVNLALQLKASRLRLELPGAPFGAALRADATTDNVPVGLSVHAPAIPFALIARQAGLPGPAGGAVRMAAELRGTGRSLRDLAASLDGQLAVTMNNGSMSNAALLSLASTTLDALGIKVPQQGETAINCLGVIGTFSKGTGRFRTLALDTPYLELSGTGQIDMGAETVALRIHPQAHMSGSSVTVPVVVDGPFGNLQPRLDASVFDQLGLLFTSWFGGNDPDTCADTGLKQ
jgi:uncharacterized protein involved in outer membrane biogenesis